MLKSILGFVILLFGMNLFASSDSLEKRILETFASPIFTAVVDVEGVEYKTDLADPYRYRIDSNQIIHVTDKKTGKEVYQLNHLSVQPSAVVHPVLGTIYSTDKDSISVMTPAGAVIGSKYLTTYLNPPIADWANQRLFLSAGVGGRDEVGHLFVVKSNDLGVEKHFYIGQKPHRPVISEDKKHVVVAQSYGDITIIDSSTLVTKTVNLRHGYPSIPVITKDSRFVLMTMRDGGAAAIDLNRAELVHYEVANQFRDFGERLSISPDEKRLFVLVGGAIIGSDYNPPRALVVIDVERLNLSKERKP